MSSPLRARKPSLAATVGLLLGTALLAAGPAPLSAAVADLADVPLASATTVEILPNIGFIYDDSGSMNDENMPDDDGTNKDKVCWKWHGYNTLAYNPAVTYLPPKKADGTRYPDSSFTAAPRDGFFAIGQKMYDGSTTNTAVDLSLISSLGVLQSDAPLPSFSRAHRVTSVRVTLLDGTTIELMATSPAPATGTTNRDTIGAAVAASINAKTGITGFSATYDAGSDTLTIRAPDSQAGLTSTPVITTQKTQSGGSLQGITASAFSTVFTSFFYSTHKTNAASTTCEVNANYTVTGNKADIAAPGAAKGSAQALTNYANWYSFYRKRAFMAKSAAGEAFAALGQDKFRVGLFFIASIEGESDQAKTNNDLKIDKFSGSTSGTHRAAWFDRLYNSRQALYTPLRGALSRMGRMYAGKVAGWDPVQYSCQRNFAILTTDGFWNTQAESATYGPLREDNVTFVGDQDGAASRPSFDSSKATNTLADVAYYYYHTDLRQGTCTVCDNNVPPAGTNPLTDDVAAHQHMTTFTIGLGVNGTLKYQDGYRTSTSGDYYDIKQGTKNWPSPTTDAAKIDDLWHAAVNGRGTYFSAKNSQSFVQGITSALGSIESTTGSGAAAATSNLQPTAGDNFIYIANYRTVTWDGELSAYSVDLASGTISATPLWLASPLLDAKVAASGDSDTRTIYTSTTTALKEFRWANLTGAEQALFDPTKLTQAIDWTPVEKTAATGESLVNYLRGHNRLENQDRPVDFGVYFRLYRDREKILGDIVHSQPVFVKASFYTFGDAGYPAFKEATKTRPGTVYVASNEGMLHAFDETGNERWAYVPPFLMKDMYRLADRNYPTNHRFFIDGPIAVSDVQVGGTWKTILVGALGKGGRGIYALDITSPAAPKFLWTFTADDDPNLGYTFGTPMITKLDGKWVVLVASGYNNIPEGGLYAGADGRGYVWALDAGTGKQVFTWSTGEGNVANPSGLARLNLYVPNFEKDNSMQAAYGGDLQGNMYRFDPDGTVHKIMKLGTNQAITAPPEIGEVDGKTVLYFGTGRYLGEEDLKSTEVQSIYAVWDDGNNTSTVDKTQLVQQTISGNNISSNPVDWGTQYGWYVDLAKVGERVSLAAQLYFGTLIVTSTIPSATECQPGGSSRLYFLNYKTGGPVAGTTPIYDYVAPIVGITVSKLPGGTPKVYAITATGGFPKGEPPTMPIDSSSAGGSLSGQRIMWRELIN